MRPESDPRPRRARPDADTLILFGGCAIAVAVTIWLTSGIWAPGVPAGDDTAAHLVRTEYAFRHLFPAGELDGWQTSFGLGYQQSMFIGPGFTIAVALVKVASLGTLSTMDAFKATIVGSLAVVPLGVAFLAWSFGLGRRTAGIAAVLSLLVSSQYGGAGLAGVFQTGLIPNQLGTIGVCLSLGGVVLVLRQPSVERVVFTALVSAALIATHPLATIIVTFLAAALVTSMGIEWLVGHWREALAGVRAAAQRTASPADAETDARAGSGQAGPMLHVRLLRPLGALLGAAVLAGGLAGFMLVPLLLHGDLRGDNSAWPDVALFEYLADMWHGEFLFRPYVFAFVLLGIGFVLVATVGRIRMGLTLVLTPVVFLGFGRLFIDLAPDNIVAIQLTNRAYAYVGLLAVLPLAFLLATPRHAASTLATGLGLVTGRPARGRARVLRGLDVALPLGVAVLLVLAPPKLNRAEATVVKPTPAIADAAEALARLVPDTGRFAMQREPARERSLTGMSHPDFWLAWATQKNTLNIFNIESSKVFEPVFESEHMSETEPDEEADALARLGVSHVLLINTSEAPALLISPRFRTVWHEDSMAILEVHPRPGQPAPGQLLSTPSGQVEAQVTRQDPEHLHLDVTSDRRVTAAIAIGWSPKWHMTVNGDKVPTRQTADHLLAVELPAGTSSVDLRFGSDGADALGRTLTLVSVVITIVWLGVTRRRRSLRSEGVDTPSTDHPTEAPAGTDGDEGLAEPVTATSVDERSPIDPDRERAPVSGGSE